MTGGASGTALWTPGPADVESANITRFGRWCEARGMGSGYEEYDRLWTWSVTEIADFWAAVWSFYGLDETSGYDRVLSPEAMPGAGWFPGARVNFADHALRQGDDSDVACISVGEDGSPILLTRGELRAQVASLAVTLQELGVRRGDRVVGYLSNSDEAIVAFLATAAVGAVWSSTGLEYSAAAAANRFRQLDPKVLIASDGYRFGGDTHDCAEAVRTLAAELPSLTGTIVVRRVGSSRLADDAICWERAVGGEAGDFAPEPVPFDHPLWVLFSSGTTGLPKGLVHSHGGILLEYLKFLGLHMDLRPGDRFFWFTSPSWVVWNLLASCLITGATAVCYDGSPTYPRADALWRVVADLGVTVFGTSPGYLDVSNKAGVEPAGDLDLSSLRIMSTTGSPLPAESHRWAAEHVGDLPLFSVSGGTDVASVFCGGALTVEVRAGEIPVRCLGVAMDSWDAEGRPTRGVGELVVTRPLPSMPLRLWGDTSGERYRDTYFSYFPGIWRHGDWITITERGSVVVHGRSDATLNRHGVRIGSAEIYAAVERVPEVSDSLIVGVEEEGGYWMPLFVSLRDGHTLDEPLRKRIVATIREWASPRHVPDEIIAVRGLARTHTAKRLEVPVKRLMQGAPLADVVNLDAVDDPRFLDDLADIASRHREALPTRHRATHVDAE